MSVVKKAGEIRVEYAERAQKAASLSAAARVRSVLSASGLNADMETSG